MKIGQFIAEIPSAEMGRIANTGTVYGSGDHIDRSIFIAGDPNGKASAIDLFHGQ